MNTTHTSTQTADLPQFLEGFATVHGAMRRDAARLAPAVADGADPAALARWYARYFAVIEHHHEREDTVVWPLLTQRAADFTPEIETLTDDHARLDAAMAAVADALAAQPFDTARAVSVVEAFAAVLNDHLDREEAAAFPRLAATFTTEEWEGLERQLLKGTTLRGIAFEIPWAMEGMDPEHVDEMLTVLPAPLRLLNRYVFVPAYRRLASPLPAVA